MGDGVLGPGDSANDDIEWLRNKYKEAGKPTFGYNCGNHFLAWTSLKMQELIKENEKLKISQKD